MLLFTHEFAEGLEDVVGAFVSLCRAIVNLDALKNAWNDLADDVEGSLVPHYIKAELRARSMLHLNKHNRLVRLLKLEDGSSTESTWEHFAFHDIGHVLKAEVEIEILFLGVIGHKNIKCLMAMTHLFDLSAFCV